MLSDEKMNKHLIELLDLELLKGIYSLFCGITRNLKVTDFFTFFFFFFFFSFPPPLFIYLFIYSFIFYRK